MSGLAAVPAVPFGRVGTLDPATLCRPQPGADSRGRVSFLRPPRRLRALGSQTLLVATAGDQSCSFLFLSPKTLSCCPTFSSLPSLGKWILKLCELLESEVLFIIVEVKSQNVAALT